MARILAFRVDNFKGIEATEIELIGRSSSPVLTLIGLNESGKTTILEALSHFVTGDRSVAELFDRPAARASALGLIPLHRKAAFTGTISIGATIQLDTSDIDELRSLAKKHKLKIDTDALEKPFEAKRTFEFEDSTLKTNPNYWYIPIRTKSARAGQFSTYKRPEKESEKPDLWLECVNLVQGTLEQISYFPTFLVDMPARIYLREHEKETAINRHYRYVFQDILDSLDEGLSLEKHVSKRIQDFQATTKAPAWLSVFFGSASKTPIDSVFQKISNAITKEVLGSWQRVFQRAISAKSISVEWNVDVEKENLPYASFYVSDGESRYAINERSLGFRWFFSFLLFTAFKQAQQRKTIFIFDEPAANLHAKAQAELLTSFSRIASNGNRIIYSTHSHHMINPRWLSAAYIVENSALDYDTADSFALDTKPTNIRATPYRQFVSAYPTRSSYFQPVVEKLEYVPPELVGSGPYLIVEGVSDFYALTLAKRSSAVPFSFSLWPGVGSGASDATISQLLGQGQKFAILLDDDAEGRKAATRYRDEWYLPGSAVLTLGAIAKDFEGKALEQILGSETLSRIQADAQSSSPPTKKQVGWYLAEACASDNVSALPSTAIDRLTTILKFAEKLFDA